MILPDQNLQPAKKEKFPACGVFDDDDDSEEPNSRELEDTFSIDHVSTTMNIHANYQTLITTTHSQAEDTLRPDTQP